MELKVVAFLNKSRLIVRLRRFLVPQHCFNTNSECGEPFLQELLSCKIRNLDSMSIILTDMISSGLQLIRLLRIVHSNHKCLHAKFTASGAEFLNKLIRRFQNILAFGTVVNRNV